MCCRQCFHVRPVAPQSEADAEEDVDARAGSRPTASPASGAYSPSHMTEETADAMPAAQDDAMASRPSWQHNSVSAGCRRCEYRYAACAGL